MRTRTEPPETIRPDSESDHVKYKAAKRTLQGRSLWFLLTEKNQDLGVSAQRRSKSLITLCRVQLRLGDLLAGKTQDLGFLLAERIQDLIFSGQRVRMVHFLGSWCTFNISLSTLKYK